MLSRPSGNQLTRARSAYLRSAAHQPIHWYEWSDEAFDRARHENKPILLDIGAVWCHWCHVMDGESYENEETASLINEKFVAIKVDRDERPDIDSRMQSAIQAISGQGGWPLTVFLTPEGRPFFGGTYFPPDDRYGRPGFKHVLFSIAEYFQKAPAEIIEQSEKVGAAITSVENIVSGPSEFSPQLLDEILNSMVQAFDAQHGGFGTAPKFPHPAAIELLLNHYRRSGEAWALSMAETTLTKMARGGVYDQVGGGFHRYSTDEHWTVPHFEKMAYDNSELLKNYLHAYQVTRNPFYREVAEGILSWVGSVLSDPAQGGFYASQDADIDLNDDGDYFTWTVDELKAAVTPEEGGVLQAYYGVESIGDMHHNRTKNVLEISMEPCDVAVRLGIPEENVHRWIASGKRRLQEARFKRETPFVDTTLYTQWNAMMISAFLEGWKVLGDRHCLDFALKSLDLLLTSAYSPEAGMYHSLVEGTASVSGLLDDQVQMTNALLDAYEVTLHNKYFDLAEQLMQWTLEQFWDSKDGGFLDVPRDRPVRGALAAKRKPFQDSPTPAANSVAALVLQRLYHYTEDSIYREKVESLLGIFGKGAARSGLFAATYGMALALYYQQPLQVLIVAGESDEQAELLLAEARQFFQLGKIVLRLTPQQVRPEILPPTLYSLAKNLPLHSLPRAFVCRGFSCSPPVDTPAALAEMLSARPA
jgi:uncharacterized protein